MFGTSLNKTGLPTMIRFLLFALFSVCSLFGRAAAAADGAEPYRLRHGDSVLVSVWREEALHKEVRVLPDGSITFPLAGRVEVAGLSSPEVERRLADKIKEFIPDPVVTVVITGIEGSCVYILGKVLKPGPVVLSSPLTVLQALSQAGGLDKFADGDSIQVLRTTAKGPELLAVRYNDLIKGRDLNSNVLLKPGDTILVPDASWLPKLVH